MRIGVILFGLFHPIHSSITISREVATYLDKLPTKTREYLYNQDPNLEALGGDHEPLRRLFFVINGPDNPTFVQFLESEIQMAMNLLRPRLLGLVEDCYERKTDCEYLEKEIKINSVRKVVLADLLRNKPERNDGKFIPVELVEFASTMTELELYRTLVPVGSTPPNAYDSVPAYSEENLIERLSNPFWSWIESESSNSTI